LHLKLKRFMYLILKQKRLSLT